MNAINLSIIAGQDGGLVIYEFIDGETTQTPVFGGDLGAASKYLESRMSKIIVTGERKESAAPRKTTREAPISTNLRRLEELEAAE